MKRWVPLALALAAALGPGAGAAAAAAAAAGELLVVVPLAVWVRELSWQACLRVGKAY